MRHICGEGPKPLAAYSPAVPLVHAVALQVSVDSARNITDAAGCRTARPALPTSPTTAPAPPAPTRSAVRLGLSVECALVGPRQPHRYTSISVKTSAGPAVNLTSALILVEACADVGWVGNADTCRRCPAGACGPPTCRCRRHAGGVGALLTAGTCARALPCVSHPCARSRVAAHRWARRRLLSALRRRCPPCLRRRSALRCRSNARVALLRRELTCEPEPHCCARRVGSSARFGQWL